VQEGEIVVDSHVGKLPQPRSALISFASSSNLSVRLTVRKNYF